MTGDAARRFSAAGTIGAKKPAPRSVAFFFASAILGMLFTMTGSADSFPRGAVFTHMCDASAAAVIDHEHFIVADDEENILRVYSRHGGAPIHQVNLAKFLKGGGRDADEEADLEGAAQIGNRTYWIGSHGRNKKGEASPGRQRFFATQTESTGGRLTVYPVGRPYSHLLEDLLRDERLAPYRLGKAAALAPKEAGALNIEGLAATPDGHLLIGFRNPVRNGKALIVPLRNPGGLIEGERAQFGSPFELDLEGLGVRSFGWDGGRYLIIAGHYGAGGRSRLYAWKGGSDQPELVPRVSFRGLNPEGIMFSDATGKSEYFVLSDDGAREIEGTDCKSLKDPAQKRFRGTLVTF